MESVTVDGAADPEWLTCANFYIDLIHVNLIMPIPVVWQFAYTLFYHSQYN